MSKKKQLATLHIVLTTIAIIYMWIGIILPAQPWEGYGWLGKVFAVWILFGTFYASWNYVYKPKLEILKKKEQ